MKTSLEGLRWHPAWTSHIGCLKGCLDYLAGADAPSRAWVFGATGHAFLLNIHPEVCPSGPTAWKTRMIATLAANIGARLESVVAWKSEAGFAARQEDAFRLVRDAVEAGEPCYGWELALPEFYVVTGCDDTRYLVDGPCIAEVGAAKPWRELGMTEIGVLEVHRVSSCPPAPDDVTVRAAITAFRSGEHVLDGYTQGPEAFEVWARALEEGTARTRGHAYNAAVWAECREEAVAFLKEAQERLAGRADGLFGSAMGHYAEVASALAGLSERHPLQGAPPTDEERFQSAEEAAEVRRAAVAEEQGLDALARAAETL